jgi:hypothetical protein
MDIYDELRMLLAKLNSSGVAYAVCGGFAQMKRLAGRPQDLLDLEKLGLN